MRLFSRPLTAENVTNCQNIWGDRSFYSANELSATLQCASDLLRTECARGTLIVDENARTRFFGMTVFARDAAIEQLFTHPRPRLGAALFRDCGAAAILDSQGIARGNAGGGLHLVVISQGYEMSDATDAEWGTLMGTLLKDFQEVHRGFRLARIVGEVFGREGVDILTTSGVYQDVHLFAPRDRGGAEVPSAIFSITHDQAIRRCSMLLPMFTYVAPRIGLTVAEKAVIREALRGATDVQVKERLRVSLAAVKSRWTRAYDRILSRAPGVLPLRDAHNLNRGPQVRHRVLDFVRDNPSELTPYDSS